MDGVHVLVHAVAGMGLLQQCLLQTFLSALTANTTASGTRNMRFAALLWNI